MSKDNTISSFGAVFSDTMLLKTKHGYMESKVGIVMGVAHILKYN